MHLNIKSTLKINYNHISKQACSAPIMNILKKQIFDIITNTLIKKKIEWFSLLYIVHVDRKSYQFGGFIFTTFMVIYNKFWGFFFVMKFI